MHWCILRLYPLLLFTLSAKKHKFTHLRFYGLTANFANLPNFPFYAPKAARSDRKFTNLLFYGAFLGNNGIYHFTVLPFYGALWQKTCLRPAPFTQTHSRMEQIRKTHMPKQPPKMVHVQLRAPMFTFERFHKGSTLLISGSWSWQCQCNRGSGTAIIRCSGSNSHSRELPGHGTHGRDTRQGLGSGPGPGNLGCGSTSQTGEFWLNFHEKLVISPHEKEGLTAEMGQMGLGLAPVSCFSHQDSW